MKQVVKLTRSRLKFMFLPFTSVTLVCSDCTDSGTRGILLLVIQKTTLVRSLSDTRHTTCRRSLLALPVFKRRCERHIRSCGNAATRTAGGGHHRCFGSALSCQGKRDTDVLGAPPSFIDERRHSRFGQPLGYSLIQFRATTQQQGLVSGNAVL